MIIHGIFLLDFTLSRPAGECSATGRRTQAEFPAAGLSNPQYRHLALSLCYSLAPRCRTLSLLHRVFLAGDRDLQLQRPGANSGFGALHLPCDLGHACSGKRELAKALIIIWRPWNRFHFFGFSPISTRRRMASIMNVGHGCCPALLRYLIFDVTDVPLSGRVAIKPRQFSISLLRY